MRCVRFHQLQRQSLPLIRSRRYNDLEQLDGLTRAQATMEKTKQVMASNINSALQRGARLDEATVDTGERSRPTG